MKVCVIGMGYIGLPTALLLAKGGNDVIGFDVDERKIALLRNGKLPFDEKGLDELYRDAKGNFQPSDEITEVEVFIIAVPTPQIKGEADLQYIFSAISYIKKVLRDDDLIILESTVGPLDCVKRIIPEIEKIGKNFKFAHCPERAIPGNSLYEMVNNARIIGGVDKETSEYTAKIYKNFVKGDLFLADPTLAAVCKVMENTYRDSNIALANEFARIADELGFDAWKAIELANKHPRVNILSPGPGVGGHCIPIDPWFFTAVSNSTDVILASREVNDGMPSYVANQIKKIVAKHDIKNPTIGILGYAYKKNVDDSRETPSEEIRKILSEHYKVLINDPFIDNNEFKDLDEVLNNSKIIVLVTDHDVYKGIKFSKQKNIMAVYDTRNIFTPENIEGSKAFLYTLGKDKI